MLFSMYARILFALLMLCVSSNILANTPSSFDARMVALAQQLTEATQRSKELHVAVVGFTNLAGKETELGNVISEEVTTRLFQTNRFNIVERAMLAKVLKEQKLELNGPVDPEAIKSLGRLLKVEAIITGRFVNRPTDVRVYARIVDTMTGEIRSVAQVTLEKDALILGLLGESAPRMSYYNPPSDAAIKAKTHFPEFTVEHMNFKFEVTRSYKDENGFAVFEIQVTNNGPAAELTFGKNGWRGDDAVLGTNWGTTYKHYRLGIIGAERSFTDTASHFFTPGARVGIMIRFRDAGKNVFLCSSLAIPVTGIESRGIQRYITFTDLPKK